MAANQTTVAAREIEAMTSEDLVGRMVCFALKPELQGHITAVHVFRAGRTMSVSYFEGDEAKSQDCDAFQLQLVET